MKVDVCAHGTAYGGLETDTIKETTRKVDESTYLASQKPVLRGLFNFFEEDFVDYFQDKLYFDWVDFRAELNERTTRKFEFKLKEKRIRLGVKRLADGRIQTSRSKKLLQYPSVSYRNKVYQTQGRTGGSPYLRLSKKVAQAYHIGKTITVKAIGLGKVYKELRYDWEITLIVNDKTYAAIMGNILSLGLMSFKISVEKGWIGVAAGRKEVKTGKFEVDYG